jgi:hypothetical protein
MVSQWKRELLDNPAGHFDGKSGKAAQKTREEIDTLYPALFIRAPNERFTSSGDRYRPTVMSSGRWVADQSITFTD